MLPWLSSYLYPVCAIFPFFNFIYLFIFTIYPSYVHISILPVRSFLPWTLFIYLFIFTIFPHCAALLHQKHIKLGASKSQMDSTLTYIFWFSLIFTHVSLFYLCFVFTHNYSLIVTFTLSFPLFIYFFLSLSLLKS